MYRRALSLDPNDAPALHLLGVVLHQKDRSAEGAQLIQRAMARGLQTRGGELDLASMLPLL